MSRRTLTALALFSIAVPCRADDAPKIEPKADETLKAMSKYLAGLKAFSFQADESFDEVPEGGQKLQLSNRRKVTIQRPNHVASEFEGDTGNRLFFYDGTLLTVVDREKKSFGTFPLRRPIDEMLDALHERFGMNLPLADFLFSDPYKALAEHAQTGRYVGLHHAAGVKCHHLAFTQPNIDWQIWIDAGANPAPRKFVITYKQTPGEPQFAAVIAHFDPAPKTDDTTFRFAPPAEYSRIRLLELPALRPKNEEPKAKNSEGKP
jgi:hypothetical protein